MIFYRNILRDNKIHSLKLRRIKLSLNFAKKCLKHKKFNKWFMPTEESRNNIVERTQFKEVRGKHKKILKTPIPYLTKLLNTNNQGKMIK